MLLVTLMILAQISATQIAVDVAAIRGLISPFIFGKNNALSDSPSQPLQAGEWQRLRDAGVRIVRENGGNNATKYNWQLRLGSHPDWYNNVYPHDWDFAARSLQQHVPGVQGMWALGLIGKAASATAHNFDDWGYNNAQWWPGVSNNWAGGGGPSSGDGDASLYLQDWPVDSVVAILDHWFDGNGLGLNSDQFLYWNMDNEADIWSGTHDDVMPVQPDIEEFISRYIETAIKARARFPGIRLAGPVITNEWQWYNWNNDKITSGGQSFTYLEYFIKRIAEEQASAGVRLLDVLDLHFYPTEQNPEDIVQLHRIWFDEQYEYPGANGVKRTGPGAWDDGLRREFVFKRCRDWLDQYFGSGHHIGLGVSEMGIQGEDANVTAVWYASTLGVFADEAVEVFTPWYWKAGMWEVLHLWSTLSRELAVAASSDAAESVSAHASRNAAGDSLTIMLIHRSLHAQRSVEITVSGMDIADGSNPTSALYDLPAEETFVSVQDNAVRKGSAAVVGNRIALDLPPLSVTAIVVAARGPLSVGDAPLVRDCRLSVSPNPSAGSGSIRIDLARDANARIELYDIRGRRLATIMDERLRAGTHLRQFDVSHVPDGVHILRLATEGGVAVERLTLLRNR
jgi:hypothetical protein